MVTYRVIQEITQSSAKMEWVRLSPALGTRQF